MPRSTMPSWCAAATLRQRWFCRGLQGKRTAGATQGTPDLRAELVAFQFELSQRGRDSYEAASGFHDDLVLAFSLAVWNAEKDQGWVWRE